MTDDRPASPQASAATSPGSAVPIVGAETAMLALYDGVLARYPQLAGQLARIRADHAAHLDALRSIVRPTTSPHRQPPCRSPPAPESRLEAGLPAHAEQDLR